MSLSPLIRLIVVNYNGRDMTVQCLERLSALDWPAERLELVLVDNASTDGVEERVRRELPHIRVVRSERNLGFAGGANRGLTDLGEVEYVGFVNNDAFPEADWLHPLVDAMEGHPEIGAAAPKILLAPRFVPVELRSPTFRPATADTRKLGVMVMGVRFDDVDGFSRVVFAKGFHGREHGPHGPFEWTDGDAALWFPFEPGTQPTRRAQVRLQAAHPVDVVVTSGGWATTLSVGTAPCWFEVSLEAEPFDVINNAGSRLVRGGWAGDRGFMEPDQGQFDEPAEVFAWCGAAALLKRSYLDDVGGFDDDLFLYYEDTDLSWRGRLRGWRYWYVPTSVVRHLHSATSTEGSALFNHFVDRNRLLIFLRNAPLPEVSDAIRRYLSETVAITRRDVIRPALERRPVQPVRARQKARSFAAFLRHAPVAATQRATDRPKVERRTAAAWAEPA